MKEKRILGKCMQFFATICLGPISLGASLAWTSPVLPVMLDRNSTASLHITIEESSWVGSMLAIGALTSAIPAGFLADRFGPKKCTIALALPVILFTLIVICTNDIYSLCVARVFSGIATGGVSVVGPMYISEISDVSLRGILGSFFELLIYVGVVTATVCGSYLHYITLTIILGLLALVLGVSFIFLPESPTYLVKMNKKEQAARALIFYRHSHYDATEDIENISKFLYSKSQGNTSKISIRKLLSSKAAIRGLIACVGITTFQQLSGVDGITFYAVQIFQATNTNIDAYSSAIIISIAQLISALLVVFIIEKAGRKVFLYSSSLGTCVCLFSLGLFFTLKSNDIYFVGLNALPIASLVFYTITFALGLGPIPWLVNGELFAPEIKGLANGITITTNWGFLFIITKTLPILVDKWGYHYTFYMYSFFMIICAIFIKFCIPETRGKTLEQIQQKLNS